MKKILKKLDNFITKMKGKNVFLYIFILIFMEMFIYKMCNYGSVNTYTLSFYRISYRFGFISRGFIGTIFDLLGLNSKSEIIVAILFITFSFMILLSCILNQIVKKHNNSFILIALLFIFNTASITNYYSLFEFGRLDIFTYMYAILSLYLIYKKKIYYLPIVSLIGMLTHENFMIWVGPLVSMILLYEYFKDKKKNKLYLKTFIVNLLVLFSMCILVRFVLIKVPYANASEFTRAIQINTDFIINRHAINDYYFMTPERNEETFITVFTYQNYIDYTVASIGLVALLFIILKVVFIPNIKLVNKTNKLLFILTIISCFCASVLFFRVCDYGRWYGYIVNSLLMLCAYNLLTNNALIHKKLSKLMIIMIICYIGFSIYFYPTNNFDMLKYIKSDDIVERIGNGK